jgi:hypothetical protein
VTTKLPSTTRQMTSPDADILLAIEALRHKYIPCPLLQSHVYGHQDSKPRDRLPSISSTDSLPSLDSTPSGTSTYKQTLIMPNDENARRLNILSDKLAGTAAQMALQGVYPQGPIATLPYPGSKALIRIGETWITSHIQKHVAYAYHSQAMQDYCMKKYSWSLWVYNSIDWDAIRRAWRRGTQTQLMHTSKLMYGWLPVNHVVGRYSGITQCPGCCESDETLDHLFHCPHPAMTQARLDSLASLRRFLIRSHISRGFSYTFLECVTSYLEGTSPYTTIPLGQETYQSQLDIGHSLFLRGFLSTKWTSLLRFFGHDHPEHGITSIISHMWHEFFHRIWVARNHLLHRSQNMTTATLEHQLEDKLNWYLSHKTHALSRVDQLRISFTWDDLPTMPLHVKKEWVRHLDAAKAAWDIERLQLERRQSVITNFFTRTTTHPGDIAVT